MPDQLTKALERAIRMEEESFKLYSNAQKKTKLQSSRNFFKELADIELDHKRKLTEVLNEKTQIKNLGHRKNESANDLRIVDYMKDVKTLSEDADYQEILVYAAQREKNTHDYYASLARRLQNTQIGELFKRLAEEELKHKIRLEKMYDDTLLKDN